MSLDSPDVRRVVLEVCQGSACRDVGNEEFLRCLERLSGLRRGKASADGSLLIEGGTCQGRCATGPNVRLNGNSLKVEGPSQAEVFLRQALKGRGAV